MRVLMIGGTALTGPHVIRAFLADGEAEVFVMSRSGRNVYCETAIRGDRRESEALRAALAAARPDVVIDMVPFTRGDAEGLVAALDRTGVPVVACSSCDVYAAYGRIHGTEDASPQSVPITEEATLRSAFGPEGAAYDKTGVEDVLTGALEDVTILRLPVIYGWPDATRISQRLDPMLDGVKRIEMTEGRARFRMSRGLGQNVAHAIVLAARSARAGRRTYNVAEGEALSELDWTLRIAAACGWRGEIDLVPGKGPVQDLVVSSARIRSELGYREVADPGTGLAEAVAFHAFTRRGVPYRKCY